MTHQRLIWLAFLCLSTSLLFASSVQDSTTIVTPVKRQQSNIQYPVVADQDTLFFLHQGGSNFPVDVRAQQIGLKLTSIQERFDKLLDSVYLVEQGNYSKLMFHDELIMVLTENDAVYAQLLLQDLGEIRKSQVEKYLQHTEVAELTTKEWLLRSTYFVLSLIGLIVLLKLINWLFRMLNKHLSKFEKTFLKHRQNILRYFIPKNTANIFVFISNVAKVLTIVTLLLGYLPFMFGFFPKLENLVNSFYSYVERPVIFLAMGFVDFLPDLVFIIVILYITRYFIRVLKYIVEDIESERFIIKGFPKDWANTTQKIISLLLWSFALVLLYPHLPGSTTDAFKGVSIFIGALISFGSTSAIANIVAGVVITYMRPYQLGDRVKIQDTVGDVIEKSLLVTRIRTPKNEDVTIPNANIITNHLINYSANAKGHGLVLHTSITIGYDVPPEEVEALLIKSAELSESILKDPKPFVLETSLDDNYVSYELNAYTREAKNMPRIYSNIHRNILQVFNEAGVEILSPQYVAARDGNPTTVISKMTADEASPFERLVNHLTGRNQPIRKSPSEEKE